MSRNTTSPIAIDKHYPTTCCQDSDQLRQIHKLLTSITKITNHIEAQNETIIQENRSLRNENAALEIQLKGLVLKNTEMASEVEMVIGQNEQFRKSIEALQEENASIRKEFKRQNAKLRGIIESLKTENGKLRAEVDETVRMLVWTTAKNQEMENKKTRSRRFHWRNFLPTAAKCAH